MKQLIWIHSIALLVLSLSCATKPPDFPICVEMSLTRGECIKVVSGEKITVDDKHRLNDKTWWDSRPTNLILPMESWVEIKTFIIKVCKKNKNMCDSEISSWERSVDYVDEKANEKNLDWVP